MRQKLNLLFDPLLLSLFFLSIAQQRSDPLLKTENYRNRYRKMGKQPLEYATVNVIDPKAQQEASQPKGEFISMCHPVYIL
jgi:hypothetical protein